MIRTLATCLFVLLTALAFSAAAQAQSVNLSGSSTTPSNSGDTPVGAGISETLQGFTQGAPELQEAQQLRDTQSRGTFVGAEAGDMPDFLGGQQQGGTQARTAQEMGGMGRRSRGSTQPRGTRGPQFRTRLSVGFSYTPMVSPAIGQTTRTCLRRIPNFGKSSSIRARIEKNVVILEGTVASQHDRALASQIVALEPGVAKVDNRLKVVANGS